MLCNQVHGSEVNIGPKVISHVTYRKSHCVCLPISTKVNGRLGYSFYVAMASSIVSRFNRI